MTSPPIRRVAITGALGNLGGKLIRYLVTRPDYEHLAGLDLRAATAADYASILPTHGAKVRFYAGNLADWDDPGWHVALEGMDALVHFAAQNPFPEASWTDATVSYAMTLNVVRAAEAAGVRRIVFASSNHVMGRYKDDPRAAQVGPGELRPDLEVGVGTIWHTGLEAMDSTIYAVPRVAAEWLLTALATQTGGAITTVCVRIGWCQPGENRPQTLSAAGTPTVARGDGAVDDAEYTRSDRWFKSMWLSNRDFVHLFDRALQAHATDWPKPGIIVNGMSANTDMKWSLDETRRYLGYAPQDNVFAPEHWQS
jgi:nucleoside-diphosphate-sugar epimerase